VRVGLAAFAGWLVLAVPLPSLADSPYPWLSGPGRRDSLESRIQPPSGYERIAAADGTFAAWLRGLPLRPAGSTVRLFDGREKADRDAAFAVIEIDVGERDLQQCADAVIRLRAEYLRSFGCEDRIAFAFTSGDVARWPDWRAGARPIVSGNRVTWATRHAADPSYTSFRAYLDSVFTYAGSYSLAGELEAVADPRRVQPGDVFIQGGFPGHAVLVADVAEAHGERSFLLLQSFMPAQEIHVLANPATPASPWYPALADGNLDTPEWRFSRSDLRRFPGIDCRDAAR
jgi:hypothetical protein